MKKEYMKPTVNVMEIQHHSIICTSPDKGYDVIAPGEPNAPAGVKYFRDYNVWDDDW